MQPTDDIEKENKLKKKNKLKTELAEKKTEIDEKKSKKPIKRIR